MTKFPSEADPALQRTPIIFLTALVTKAEAKAGLHIQGHAFIAKPISIPDLIKGIEENLHAHAAFKVTGRIGSAESWLEGREVHTIGT